MTRTQYPILEERDFYTTAKDGSEVIVEADLQATVELHDTKHDLKDFSFANVKLVVYPGSKDCHKLPVISFYRLSEYIHRDELKKIEASARAMILDYGKELMEEQSRRFCI